MYQERKYRRFMNPYRFTAFEISYRETDLWVAVNGDVSVNQLSTELEIFIRSLRIQLDRYIERHQLFNLSFQPVDLLPGAPTLAVTMAQAAACADVGPMAAVAGAFADTVGKLLVGYYGLNEAIVENGGDCFISVKEPLQYTVFAGESPLSEKLALSIDRPGTYGICTSSGTVGHSFSFGKADAVTIVCDTTVQADAYATAYANKIQNEDDVERVIAEIRRKKDIVSAVAICGEKAGICGNFPVYPLEKEIV